VYGPWESAIGMRLLSSLLLPNLPRALGATRNAITACDVSIAIVC
jgi:hypothetical protein